MYILCYSQYDTVTEIKINNIQIRTTKESYITQKMGVPRQIKEEIDYAGDGESIKIYCYGDSCFKCWNGLLQSFLIKDSTFTFNDSFKVGDNINVFKNSNPLSFQNPLSIRQISDFDSINFNFDKCYWLDAGGGDGVLIFSKDSIITGYRYSYGP